MADAKSYRSIHRWARIAPRKARLVADLVRGMPVNDAIAVLENHPRRGAKLLHKVIKSALANASNDLDVDLNALVVSEARVDMGPLLGGRARWRPRAMGRATPIRKRTSHLKVALTESSELTSRRSRRKAAKSEEPAAVETAGEGGEE
jgi:large subunit ribosomal protein L22